MINANQLKSYVIEDNTEQALKDIVEFLKDRDVKLSDECIILQSRLKKLKSDISKGVISYTEGNKSQNQINTSVLAIINEVEVLVTQDEYTVNLPKVSEDNIQKIDGLIKKSFEPALMRLKQDSLAEKIKEKFKNTYDFFYDKDSVPVLLIGLTGAGKTSLLNAILEKNLGIAGGGGAQSATSLIVSYSESSYTVSVKYLSLDDINKHFEIVKLNKGRKDLFIRPDEKSLPEVLEELLTSIVDSKEALDGAKIKIDNIKPSLKKIISSNTIEYKFEIDEYDQLLNLIQEHTNSRGKFWSITKSLNISGPFEGIEPNTTIIDLPGLGDLNKLRVEKTLSTLQNASQIIVVVGERGLTENVRRVLAETKVISYLLTNPTIPRVSIVGTKLDNTIINNTEIYELGLSPDCEDFDIIKARFNRWEVLIKSQWREILTTWSSKTNIKATVSFQSIENIISHTDFIPCSPLGFLSIKGLEIDRKGIFKSAFTSSEGNPILNTGILSVRESISRLSRKKADFRNSKLKSDLDEIKSEIETASKDILSLLQGDIISQSKIQNKIRKIDDEFTKLESKQVKYSNSKFLSNAKKKLSKIKELINVGWKDLDDDALKRILSSHLEKVHFQTLKASLKRKGQFVSTGKQKTKINIPQKLGIYISEPLTNYVHEEILPEFLDEAINNMVERQNELTIKVEKILDKKTFNDSQAQSLISNLKIINSQYTKRVKDFLHNNRPLLSEFNILQTSIDSIGVGFQFIMTASLEVARGEGARKAAIRKLISSSKEMMPAVKKEIFEDFTTSVIDKLQSVIEFLQEELIKEKNIFFDEMRDKISLVMNGMDLKDKEISLEEIRKTLDELEKIKATINS